MRRTYLVVGIIAVTVAALLGYTVQHYLGGPVAPQKSVVSGSVSSVQSNSNFSLILFTTVRTNVTYSGAVTNGTAVGTCRGPSCVYSISLYSNEPYSATIQVETTSFGAVPCPAQPPIFTPTGLSFHQNFLCNKSF